MNNTLVFLDKLNNEIPSANSVNGLYRKHSIALINDMTIDVQLFPATGGQYSIPVIVKDRSIDDIIDEIWEKYHTCRIISNS